MPNEQLVSYIRTNSPAFPKQTLTQALMAQGWAVADIAAAFSHVEKEMAGVTGQQPTAPTQDANFLAEMERHRKESEGYMHPIVDGNTEIRPASIASKYIQPQTAATGEQKGIIGLLIKTGLVKNETQANVVMIIFIVVVFGITAYLLL